MLEPRTQDVNRYLAIFLIICDCMSSLGTSLKNGDNRRLGISEHYQHSEIRADTAAVTAVKRGNTVPKEEPPATDVKIRSTRKTKKEERRILTRHKCEYITKVNSNNRNVRVKRAAMGNLSWRGGRRNISFHGRNLNTVKETGQALYPVTKKVFAYFYFPVILLSVPYSVYLTHET